MPGPSTQRRIIAAVRKIERQPSGTRQRRRGPRTSASRPRVFPVRVVPVAGSLAQHGDATSQCAYIYDVYQFSGDIIDDTKLATAQTPLEARPPLGWLDYVAASNSGGAWAYGDAFYETVDEEAVLRLNSVECEVPHTMSCDCTCN